MTLAPTKNNKMPSVRIGKWLSHWQTLHIYEYSLRLNQKEIFTVHFVDASFSKRTALSFITHFENNNLRMPSLIIEPTLSGVMTTFSFSASRVRTFSSTLLAVGKMMD